MGHQSCLQITLAHPLTLTLRLKVQSDPAGFLFVCLFSGLNNYMESWGPLIYGPDPYPIVLSFKTLDYGIMSSFVFSAPFDSSIPSNQPVMVSTPNHL